MTALHPAFSTLGAAALLTALLATVPTTAAPAATTFTTERGTMQVEVVSDQLESPWAMVFLPDDAGLLVTERGGRLRHVAPDGTVGAPIGGVPEVHARGQGGLLDIALAPDFPHSRRVYLAYAESGANNQAGTAVGHGRLSEDLATLDNFTTIFRQEPAESTGQHFGARLVFDAEGGHLFIALGEHNQRAAAQRLDSLQGKVVRIHPDGSIPADNPFIGRADVRPEIWSYGHRNPQGAALHPVTRQLWVHEHGPRGGDEINIPQPGLNYGWPLATHGRNYSFLPIPEAKGKSIPGAEDPWHVWQASPAISGMAFYTGTLLPDWHGNLFIGALRTRELLRLELDDAGRVTHEESLLQFLEQRIRDVREGPDGALYLLTDSNSGQLLRLGPAP
ncbi:MAG: PQQ-dependent sugar dehydrogenase [Pigmentiphaga sp.]